MKRIRIIKKTGSIILSLFVLNIICVIIYWNVSVSYSDIVYAKSYDCGILFFHSLTKQRTLSTDTKERCSLAVNLFKTGVIKRIICAGGASSDKSGSIMMRNLVNTMGVPDSTIISDTLSYSSVTNIIESSKIIKSNNFNSALLISSPTHLLRLKYIANKYLDGTEHNFATFHYDYSLLDIFLDCNAEFIKWVYLLFLPDSFKSITKRVVHF